MSLYMVKDKYVNMIVGENIRRLRRLAGLTIDGLIAKIGGNEAQIYGYENGIRKIPVSFVYRLAKELDVNVNVFFEVYYD